MFSVAKQWPTFCVYQLLDMEQRLKSLQDDFLALQQSYDTLQSEKQQWIKERDNHISLLAKKEDRIVTLEQQLNKQPKSSPHNDNSRSMKVSVNLVWEYSSFNCSIVTSK